MDALPSIRPSLERVPVCESEDAVRERKKTRSQLPVIFPPVPVPTTYASNFTSSAAPSPSTTSKPYVSTVYPSPVVPTPMATTCPTPGIYTIPATTVTLTESTTVCGAASTHLPAGNHTYGGKPTLLSSVAIFAFAFRASRFSDPIDPCLLLGHIKKN